MIMKRVTSKTGKCEEQEYRVYVYCVTPDHLARTLK